MYLAGVSLICYIDTKNGDTARLVWQRQCYDFVKRCLEESGTLPTGRKSTTMPNGVQTQSWIKQQRKVLKESGMPADKEELLSAIGIVGNLMEQN